MVNIRFTPDMAAIRKTCEAQIAAQTAALLDKKDKTFTLTIGSKKYTIRYESVGDNQIQLYVQTSEGSVDIASPKLRLNIGSFLLPEALDIGVPPAGYNPDACNDYTRDVMDTGLSEAEITLIHQKITEIGLLRLIS